MAEHYLKKKTKQDNIIVEINHEPENIQGEKARRRQNN